jgi:hypothetical protein
MMKKLYAKPVLIKSAANLQAITAIASTTGER